MTLLSIIAAVAIGVLVATIIACGLMRLAALGDDDDSEAVEERRERLAAEAIAEAVVKGGKGKK